MLTETYTLVALSVEQAKIRGSLQSLQKVLHSSFLCQNSLTPVQIDFACDALHHLYDSSHWRKIEKYLVPAMRGATRQADQLLLDLEELRRAAADAMAAVADRLSSAAVDSEARVSDFCATVDAFCSALLERLDREENELFPAARAIISGEAWFSIANDMLVHESNRRESEPFRKPGKAGRQPAATARRLQAERSQAEPSEAVFAH